MALKMKLVVPYSDIPKEVVKDHWINAYEKNSYAEVHIDEEDKEKDSLSKWLEKTHPVLISEDSFFIHMDY